MTWIVFLAVSFCFALGVWESIQTRRSQLASGVGYLHDLPPVFFTPAFKVLKLVGQLGILLAPWLVLDRGILSVFLVALAMFIAGTVMGFLIWRAVEAITNRGVGI